MTLLETVYWTDSQRAAFEAECFAAWLNIIDARIEYENRQYTPLATWRECFDQGYSVAEAILMLEHGFGDTCPNMPRASIDYLNARRELKHSRSGGTIQHGQTQAEREADDRARDRDADVADVAMAAIREFSFWAEITRQQLCDRLAIPQADTADEIPF